MKSCGGFVEDVEGASGVLFGEFGGQLDALRLATGKGGGGLPQLDVPEPHVKKGAELVGDGGNVGEELDGLLHIHLQHVVDGLAFIAHLQRFVVVAFSPARLARDVHVRQEVHLDGFYASAATLLAAAAHHVEGEAPWLVTPDLRFGKLGEELPDEVENADVGHGVRPRCATDGLLVDLYDLVYVLDAVHVDVGERFLLGTVEVAVQDRVQRLVDECGFAAARHAGDADELAEREGDGDVLQVVACCPDDGEGLAVAFAPHFRHLYLFLAAEVLRRQRPRFQDFLVRALRHDLAAVDARRRSDVNNVVRRPHHVAVVLHHDDGVAEVAQVLQRLNQLVVVALVQPDARLVQDVQHVDEAGTDLRGQPDALRLTAGQRPRRKVQREVLDAHILQKAQPEANLAKYLVGNLLFLVIQIFGTFVHPADEVGDVHPCEVGDVLVADSEMQRLLFQTVAVAFGAGNLIHESLDPFADGGGSAVGIEVLDKVDDTLVVHRRRRQSRKFALHLDRLFGAVQDDVHHAVRQFSDGVVKSKAIFLAKSFYLSEDLAVFVCTDWGDTAISDRLCRVGDDFGHIHLRHVAESVAPLARPVGGVEREGVRLRFGVGDARGGAHQVFAEILGHAAFVVQHENRSFAVFQCQTQTID